MQLGFNREIDISRKQFCCFVPGQGDTALEQLEDCCKNLIAKLDFFGLDINHVLKLTLFYSSADNQDYSDRKKEFKLFIKEYFGTDKVPVSYIGQPPENNHRVSMEAILFLQIPGISTIHHKDFNGYNYIVIEHQDYKEIYASGITADEINDSIYNLSEFAFKIMQDLLKKEGLNFNNVVRQWNYIENILGITKKGEVEISSGKTVDFPNSVQNYQLFNDVRTSNYNTVKMVNGYPAATGIGMNTGGVILDFIAIEPTEEIKIYPINNPLQKDAHKYSENVLVGSSYDISGEKTSPKFERAKLVAGKRSGRIYISGTAAIIGQDTVKSNNAGEQTKTTIKNIQSLIARENFNKNGLDISFKLENLSYIRVYIKNQNDIPEVKAICKKYFRDVPSLYLVSDICRKNLLVEIEGAVDFVVDKLQIRK